MKEKILIIEDDPLIRNELKTLLQSNSYKTVAPEDFSDVIDQIKAEQPHLIIGNPPQMDIQTLSSKFCPLSADYLL